MTRYWRVRYEDNDPPYFRHGLATEELLSDAEAVGEPEDVIRMGILCAQLGLTIEEIPKIARYWVLYGN